MRFLLVEDHLDLAQAVKEHLSLDGHGVDHAASVSDAFSYLKTESYDLILLDVMLPDGDGRDVLASLRATSQKTPVIVLTARSEVSDRVSLLDLGADDYLTKPFDFTELNARCRAVVRRIGGAAQNVITLADVAFDPVAGTLTSDARRVQLRNRELRLFEVFAAAPQQIFSKSHLVDRLFSLDTEVTENAIEVYVGRLRKHLEGTEVHIKTERGLGYKLVCT